MQDPQNNLSISSFRKKQTYLLKYAFLFFIPVVVIFTIVELLVLEMPANYKNNSTYYKENKEFIEIMAFGSSQMAGAVNPKYFNNPGICFASSSQHHKLDFTILQQLLPETKQLKFVVLELSYSHLELPHNSKNFWKNSVYLKYFNVNAFERQTYFKDKLIFLSNPDLYSRKLMEHYILKVNSPEINKYGYELSDSKSIFKKFQFKEAIINTLETHPNQDENVEIFNYNTTYLYTMLDYFKDNKLKVIICTLPLYKTYITNLNPNIVRRRDSIIKVIKNNYPTVKFLETENDTFFKISDFRNVNHLNKNGAEKFTKKLNTIINQYN